MDAKSLSPALLRRLWPLQVFMCWIVSALAVSSPEGSRSSRKPEKIGPEAFLLASSPALGGFHPIEVWFRVHFVTVFEVVSVFHVHSVNQEQAVRESWTPSAHGFLQAEKDKAICGISTSHLRDE